MFTVLVAACSTMPVSWSDKTRSKLRVLIDEIFDSLAFTLSISALSESLYFLCKFDCSSY